MDITHARSATGWSDSRYHAGREAGPFDRLLGVFTEVHLEKARAR